jgi:hypothetical protein
MKQNLTLHQQPSSYDTCFLDQQTLAKKYWRTRTIDNRVARLGEFSPFGWLFTFGSFMIITEVTHIFGLLLSAKLVEKEYILIKHILFLRVMGIGIWILFIT